MPSTIVDPPKKGRIPSHVSGLLAYLSRPHERANEDQALAYFREVFGEAFSRQKEACGSDGYVQGLFILELKGRTNDWLSGLFQGLAYKNKGLDFSQIVVAAKDFLAVWRVEDLPEEIRGEVLDAEGAPSRIGVEFAKAYTSQRKPLLRLAAWNGNEVAGTLFQQSDLFADAIASFEKTVKSGRKSRIKVTLQNFPSVLKEMKQYFDPKQPVKTVRAFFSMLYGWTEAATIQLSYKVEHKATLEGESITDLIPSKRRQFKEYVESHYVYLKPSENKDDFFARYDEALDAVDKDFRIKHGIFFTDRNLSKFVMWLVKQYVPNLGKNYLVIDPACGSGNLVTNWRSPLELRHKVVSEIEPELLFGVEKRMKGDQWHNGKFTVVPKVDENRGLNFLDISADEYLQTIRTYLAEKGHKPDRPLAFLCNPPYRSDDDQGAEAISYKIHESIIEQTGMDASSERYCCFLAQMKLICDAARSNGLPDDSLLLLFTKSAWLTRRPMFSAIRAHMLGVFEDVTGLLVKGKEFFDVKGSWPVAFTVWRYRGDRSRLAANRSIPLLDLTFVKKKELAQIPWDDQPAMERACEAVLRQANEVQIGVDRMSIQEWSGKSMTDFKRDRNKDEKNARIVGGLPLNDRRHSLKKAHGRTNGPFIGFMDDLTPCRVKNSTIDRPWFYLDTRFMSIRQARCLSGPPTHLGYCASDLDSAKRLFFWFSLAKTFLQESYPLCIDAENLWGPNIPKNIETGVFQTAFAVGYAENECVTTTFPANNPVRGLSELRINNPMSGLDPRSFWSATMRPYFDRGRPSRLVQQLVASVDDLFSAWRKLTRDRNEVSVAAKPYFVGDGILTPTAGILQIRDYALDNDEPRLLQPYRQVQECLKAVKSGFFEMIADTAGLNYFDYKQERRPSVLPLAGRSKPPRRPALIAEVGQASVGRKQLTRVIRQMPVKVTA